MRNSLLCIMVAILIFIDFRTAYTQENTDSAVYSVEKENLIPAHNFKQKYHDFTRQMVEEKTLIKIGINELAYSKDPFDSQEDHIDEQLFFMTFGLELEQKVSTSWSLLLAWRTSYEKYSYVWKDYSPGDKLTVDGREYDSPGKSYTEKFNLNEFDFGTKYYFNLKKKIRLGERANNFSADYILLKYTRRFYLHDSYTSNWRFDKDFSNKIVLGIGIQRRLSGIGFLDVSVGPAINFSTSRTKNGNVSELSEEIKLVPFNFNFNIGFGL
jgi:hypothetical protein